MHFAQVPLVCWHFTLVLLNIITSGVTHHTTKKKVLCSLCNSDASKVTEKAKKTQTVWRPCASIHSLCLSFRSVILAFLITISTKLSAIFTQKTIIILTMNLMNLIIISSKASQFNFFVVAGGSKQEMYLYIITLQ